MYLIADHVPSTLATLNTRVNHSYIEEKRRNNEDNDGDGDDGDDGDGDDGDDGDGDDGDENSVHWKSDTNRKLHHHK